MLVYRKKELNVQLEEQPIVPSHLLEVKVFLLQGGNFLGS